jgi:type IV pilus assembly protein PilA
MTTLNSRIQLAMLNRKKSKNIIQKGFTLVELMIVIVIVGVLSSVALPNFLSQASKAKGTECTSLAGSMLGEIAAEALISTTAASTLLTSLTGAASNGGTNPNSISGFCTFAPVGLASNVYGITAVGKGDLAGQYAGRFCVNYQTGKKDSNTVSGSGTIPGTGTVSC